MDRLGPLWELAEGGLMGVGFVRTPVVLEPESIQGLGHGPGEDGLEVQGPGPGEGAFVRVLDS